MLFDNFRHHSSNASGVANNPDCSNNRSTLSHSTTTTPIKLEVNDEDGPSNNVNSINENSTTTSAVSENTRVSNSIWNNHLSGVGHNSHPFDPHNSHRYISHDIRNGGSSVLDSSSVPPANYLSSYPVVGRNWPSSNLNSAYGNHLPNGASNANSTSHEYIGMSGSSHEGGGGFMPYVGSNISNTVDSQTNSPRSGSALTTHMSSSPMGGDNYSDDDDDMMDETDPMALTKTPKGHGRGQARNTNGDLASAKKTKGRVKIKMEFIDNKLRRYTTFSKRKTGIMKKAYELSTLTGTQVMLLVASETGHVYTFATRKLQPMITSDAGKSLIQTCLNSPDLSSLNGMRPYGIDSVIGGGGVGAIHSTSSISEQRMSATGYEETDLTYNAFTENLQLGQSDSTAVVHHPSSSPSNSRGECLNGQASGVDLSTDQYLTQNQQAAERCDSRKSQASETTSDQHVETNNNINEVKLASEDKSHRGGGGKKRSSSSSYYHPLTTGGPSCVDGGTSSFTNSPSPYSHAMTSGSTMASQYFAAAQTQQYNNALTNAGIDISSYQHHNLFCATTPASTSNENSPHAYDSTRSTMDLSFAGASRISGSTAHDTSSTSSKLASTISNNIHSSSPSSAAAASSAFGLSCLSSIASRGSNVFSGYILPNATVNHDSIFGSSSSLPLSSTQQSAAHNMSHYGSTFADSLFYNQNTQSPGAAHLTALGTTQLSNSSKK